MKLAIILSGSIREPEKSLASIEAFAGHDVKVFIHTWYNVEQIQKDSFRKTPALEPTSELLAKFNPQHVMSENWGFTRQKFIDDLENWKRLYKHVLPETNNIGMHGMFYSLRKCWQLLDNLHDYDAVSRLRFDCKILDNPLSLMGAFGWNIPEGNDFFGLNDQLAVFRPHPNDSARSLYEARVYFDLYSNLEAIIAGGVGHGPEAVLKAAFDQAGIGLARPAFNYTIY